MSYNESRLRRCNDQPVRRDRDFVLYFVQASRRLVASHALDYALHCCRELGRPLVVYEGIRTDTQWASARVLHVVLDGMRENRRAARDLGITYWPFVATPGAPGRGLAARMAERAAMVVTDDWPCHVVPDQTAALAARVDAAVVAVDGNSMVPIARMAAPVSAAAHLRHRIHRAFAEAWANRAAETPRVTRVAQASIDPPFEPWDGKGQDALVARLPIDQTVGKVEDAPGGHAAGGARLEAFVARRLAGYAEHRGTPSPPADGHASGLSADLHFGHLGIQEVATAVLGETLSLRPEGRGRREGFFGHGPDVDAFLDEAITWRDLGLAWHWRRRADTASLAQALPAWALSTLREHERDPRPHVYDRDALEAAATHDPLWNAAQKELLVTGRIHNTLRMLWGKKVIEWSRTPEEAYATLVHLNNKWAIDGRDPNSYTGILWCFGLFDRPWPPNKPILGLLRPMSSARAAKKYRLGPYLDWVATL